jgi:hypothetical protein
MPIDAFGPSRRIAANIAKLPDYSLGTVWVTKEFMATK